MENEMIVLSDDAGNEYRMDLIQRFNYEDETYVVLTQAHDCEEDGCSTCGGCGENSAVYVMKEFGENGNTQYAQVEDEKIDKLVEVVKDLLGVHDDCCEDDGCDCGCTH